MTLRTLRNGVTVLQAVCDGQDRTVEKLAEYVGIPRSTTYRILQTLVETGLLERSDRRYQPGVQLIHLGRAAERASDLFTRARPFLKLLVQVTGESASLSIPRGDSAFIADGFESPQGVRCAVDVGDTVALHAGAGSKALLAALGESVIERILSKDLVAYTQTTITDRTELLRDLVSATERGWSTSDAEVTPHTFGVAAVVYEASGTVAAAICITGPVARMKEAGINQHGELIAETAHDLSCALGWEGDATHDSILLNLRNTLEKDG